MRGFSSEETALKVEWNHISDKIKNIYTHHGHVYNMMMDNLHMKLNQYIHFLVDKNILHTYILNLFSSMSAKCNVRAIACILRIIVALHSVPRSFCSRMVFCGTEASVLRTIAELRGFISCSPWPAWVPAAAPCPSHAALSRVLSPSWR